MPFGPQTKIYPSNGRVRFNGGLNNKYHREIIAENESPDCANVRATDNAIETRGGTTRLNTAAVGTFACDGLYTRHTNTNTESMVAWFGGTAYVYTSPSFVTISSAQSIFTANTRVGGAEQEQYLFMGNGGTLPYKYNGAFTRHGVYAPSTSPTVASNGTGIVTGVVAYQVAYVNSAAVEGYVNTATATFTATSTGSIVRLTSIPTAPQSFGVNARRIYRQEGGTGTFKRLTTISDNTTTTYDDNTGIGTLTTVAPTDPTLPPLYNSICQAKGRMFCNDTANPNYIWYSNANDPYTFASTNFIRVGDNAADTVNGVTTYNDNIVVLCNRGIYIIYIADATPSNWQVIKTKSPFGCKSPYGTVSYENKLLFPAVQSDKFVGFAALSGDSIEPEASLLTVSTALSELKSDPIEPDMFLIVESLLAGIYAYVYKNMAYFAVPYGNGSTKNTRVYVYDFSLRNSDEGLPAWTPDTGVNVNQFTVLDGNLYAGTASADGYVHRYEVDGVYTDSAGGSSAAAIDSYYWTKEFSGGKNEQNLMKDWRFANILYELSGNYTMEMRYRTDSDLGVGDQKLIDLTPGGSLWGTLIWGSGNWSAGRQEKDIRQFFGQLRGKRIQLKFGNRNTASQKFKIIGLNFVYNVKGLR
jgi:hypothetical protein